MTGILKRHMSVVLSTLPSTETQAPMNTLTHIVCTIGPKTAGVPELIDLMDAGMDVARLNFSHGDHDYHRKVVNNVREASKKCGKIVAIMLDTKGPEIRTGKLSLGPKGRKERNLIKGEEFTFTTDQSVLGNQSRVNVTYTSLPRSVKPGDTILVDDGLISFRVNECTDDEVHCTITNSGELGEVKGVNLPGVVVDLPAVTEKDRRDIALGVELGVDFIAASFIRKADDVRQIRDLPGVRDKNIRIISKIENQEGLTNFNAILLETDGIMVARGDLGVEIPIERVGSAQKMMIKKCNLAGKIVITATQMLDSMIRNPRPTRAEATDVYNAVLDGSDAVMLSGETAKGDYPVLAVQTMAKICEVAESDIDYRQLYKEMRAAEIEKGCVTVGESVASSASKSSWDLGAKLLICLTESGHSLRLVSKYRPHAPILAVTASEQTARQVLLSRGSRPFFVTDTVDTDKVMDAIEFAKKEGLVVDGDFVVVTSGRISGQSGATNLLKIHTVGTDW